MTLIADALDDGVFFAREVLGRSLWDHQAEVVRSTARVKVLAAGRQVGKSFVVAVLVLWTVMRRPGSLVLIVSAQEDAAKRLLAEVLALALASPLVRSSVVEDGLTVVTFSNGSVVRAVAASEKAIRGWPVDLLVIDEAGFVAQSVWEAAEPSIIARPGSEIILLSSPWGARDHFFRAHYELGQAGDPMVESWNWPSTVSPLVDQAYLDKMKRTWSPARYAREIEAIFGGSEGTYFAEHDLMAAVADYEMIDPAAADGQMVCGGLDFGYSTDANVVALLGVLADAHLPAQPRPNDCTYFVAWLEEHRRMGYDDFVDRVIDIARPPVFNERTSRIAEPGGFEVVAMASEQNGVGAAPTMALQKRAHADGTRMGVWPIHTTAKRKEHGFGTIALLVKQGRLVLPRHPELLKQLAALTYETTDAGNVRISVPDNIGHDDVALALMQAASCLNLHYEGRPDHLDRPGRGEPLQTERGTWIHQHPRCAYMPYAFRRPHGNDEVDSW